MRTVVLEGFVESCPALMGGRQACVHAWVVSHHMSATTLSRSVLLAAAIALIPESTSASDTNASTGPELPALAIAPAVEISFETRVGLVHTLQSSTDLTNWSTIELPFLGSAREFKKTFSVVPQKRIFYRLNLQQPVAYVLPESIAAHFVRLRFESGGGELIHFINQTNAVSDDSLAAAYLWKRKERRIELAWIDGWTALVQLQVNETSPGSGRATVIYQERDEPPFLREGEFLLYDSPAPPEIPP
jgi:hypothetical protein